MHPESLEKYSYIYALNAEKNSLNYLNNIHITKTNYVNFLLYYKILKQM